MKDRIAAADPIPVLQESAPSREFPRRTEGQTPEVVVSYYRRMRMNRVYAMVVELKRPSDGRAGAMPSSGPVQIRPVVPGAHVTPALREVHPGTAESVATFYVTPLARGRLQDARVGIYQEGRALQEVRLPMKGVSQRTTWILLALTFLLPGALRYFTVAVDYSVSGTSAKTAKAGVENSPQKRMPRADEAGLTPQKMAGTMLEGMMRARDENAVSPVGSGPVAGKTVRQPPPPQGVLEREIKENFPEPRKENFQETWPDFPLLREPAAHGIQEGYEFLQDWEKELNVSRYLFLVLLGLTVVSWVTHGSQRSRRRVGPIAPAA